METISIDFLTIIVAAIVYVILGAFWYSPLLLGKVWTSASKSWRHVQETKPKWYSYAGGIIQALVTSFFLALVEAFLGATSTLDGVYVAIGVWLGFVATTHFSPVLWAKKPLKLYFIEQGFYLLAFVLMGGIIGS